jgi:hypothetical protein
MLLCSLFRDGDVDRRHHSEQSSHHHTKKTLNDPVNVRINGGKLKYCKHFIRDIRYSVTAAVPSLVFHTQLRYSGPSSTAILHPPAKTMFSFCVYVH